MANFIPEVKEEELSIENFKGMVDNLPTENLAKEYTPDCRNLLSDEKVGSLVPSAGYTKESSLPFGLMIDNCEALWSANTNVTASQETTIKIQGSYSAKLAIAAAFTTGLIGYHDLTNALDLSEYTQVGFWIRSSITLNSGDLRFLIDNSAGCGSPLENINIPALSLNTWKLVVINIATPANLTAVASLGIDTTLADIAVCDIYIDSIVFLKTSAQLIHNCETNWTASTNVTSELDSSDYKVGSNSIKLTIAAGFTTGLLAYKNITQIDIITSKRVGFWIKSSINLQANSLSLLLDDTNGCVSPLETITITESLVANTWTYINIGIVTPTNLSGVKSVGLKSNVDFGACIIRIDDIRALRPIQLIVTYTKEDGTSRLIASDGVCAWSSLNGTTWTGPIQLGLTSTYTPRMTTYNNILYGVNGTDYNWSWDGITTLVYNGADGSPTGTYYMPKGRCILSHAGFLIVGYADDDPFTVRYNNKSLSAGAADWFPGSRALEFVIPGEKITALYSAYAKWIVFLESDFFVIGGLTKEDFERNIWQARKGIGCSSQNSISIKDELVYFINEKGIYKMGGDFNPIRITEPVENIFNTLQQVKSDDIYWIQTLMSEFQAGTLGSQQLDATTTPGIIQQKPQTTQADFEAGTLSYIDTKTTAGDAKLMVILNPSFEDGSQYVITYWTNNSNNEISRVTSPVYSGSYAMFGFGTTLDLQILNSGGGVLETVNIAAGSLDVWESKTKDLGAYNNQQIYLRFRTFSGGAYRYLTSSLFYVASSGGSAVITVYTYKSSSGNSYWDNITFPTSGSIISQTIDYGVAPSTLGNLTAEMVAIPSGTQITYYVETRDTDSGWGTYNTLGACALGQTNFSMAISSAGVTPKRYLRWKVVLYSNSLYYTPTLRAVYVGGTFISQKNNCGGGNLTVWKQLDTEYTLNGGILTFYIRGASTEVGVDSASWVQLLSGSIIPLLITEYWAQVKVEFNMTNYNSIPSFDSFTLNWSEFAGGTLPATEMIGFESDKRYYLCGTTSDKGYNDLILMIDKQNNILPLLGYPIGCKTLFKEEIWFGFSKEAAVGRLFRGYNQEGNTYTKYWIFGPSSLGNWRERKYFQELWLEYIGVSIGTVYLDVSIDEGNYTTLDSIDISGTGTLETKRLIPSPCEGRIIKVRIRHIAKDEEFIVNRLRILYSRYPGGD